MLKQENEKKLLDIANDERLLLSSNGKSESVFDVHKRESLSSYGNHIGKRRKKSKWFYYRSSSNETNLGLDDGDGSTSRGNSVCAVNGGVAHMDNKRKRQEGDSGCEFGDGHKNAEGRGHDKGDIQQGQERDNRQDVPCRSFSSCDSVCTPSRTRSGNSKGVHSPKGRKPPDGYTHEGAEDSFTNSRIPADSRAYVRTIHAGESGTEFHSFDVEEDVDGIESAPLVAIDPSEKKRNREEREVKQNELFIEEMKKMNSGVLTQNTKVYQENIDKYNSEFQSIISEPFDQKERREKIKKRRDQNREIQMMYLNKILKSMVNKEKSHLNCLSKNFKRIEGFYKQNYKIYIIESKSDLNYKKNCFKTDVHVYDLFAPSGDNISKEVNILDEFKMYLRRCKGEYRPRKYQTHITTGDRKSMDGGKSGVDFQRECTWTEMKEHSKENGPDDNHERENEQKDTPMKNSLTKMIPKGRAVPADGEGEGEGGRGGGGELAEAGATVELTVKVEEPYSGSSQREVIKTNLTNQTPPEDGIIFYAHNKNNTSNVKEIKEGDILYIKFDNTSDDYDKIRIVKKEDLLQILIFLMRNQECLKLSNISTYSPDLLWNLSVHFKNNTYDMESNLEKMYNHFCRRYEVISPDGGLSSDPHLEFAPVVQRGHVRQFHSSFDQPSHLPFHSPFDSPFDSRLVEQADRQPGFSPEWSSENLSDCSSVTVSESTAKATKGARKFKSTKGVKRESLKEIETMKLKDYVSFLDKFLQNVNEVKLKRLKSIKTEYYEKYEFDRTINKLNRQQLLDLFVDKKNEVNTIPLSFLKEKSRNIIYEENIKMNMFACIKIIFDDVKGRCIYAASDLNKFDFVFEYVGELLTHNEAMERERKYNKNNKKGCYMFYFKHENKRYCIDGTEENIEAAINNKDKKYFLRSFARLVNHSKKNSNLIPKVLTVASQPRLFFVAARNIKEGEELLIDYGERDREIIKNNEWLKC